MDQAYFATAMAVVLARATSAFFWCWSVRWQSISAIACFFACRTPQREAGRRRQDRIAGGISIFLTRVGRHIFCGVRHRGDRLFGDAAGQSRFPAVNDLGFHGWFAFFRYHRRRHDARCSAFGGDRRTRTEVVVASSTAITKKRRAVEHGRGSALAQTIRAAKYAVTIGGWKPNGATRTFERWAREHGNQDRADLVPQATWFSTPA